jgi:hypothetical protein
MKEVSDYELDKVSAPTNVNVDKSFTIQEENKAKLSKKSLDNINYSDEAFALKTGLNETEINEKIIENFNEKFDAKNKDKVKELQGALLAL